MDLIKKQRKQIEKLLEDRHRLGQLEEQVKRFDAERERNSVTVGSLTGKIRALETQLASYKKEAEEIPLLTNRIRNLQGLLSSSEAGLERQARLLRAQDIERDRLVKERDELKSRIDEKALEKTRRRLQERGDELSKERKKVLELERDLQAARARIHHYEKNEKLNRVAAVQEQQGAAK